MQLQGEQCAAPARPCCKVIRIVINEKCSRARIQQQFSQETQNSFLGCSERSFRESGSCSRAAGRASGRKALPDPSRPGKQIYEHQGGNE